MGNNRRKVYEADGEAAGGIPCRECGCRHSWVTRTEKIGATVRRTRRCRNCGRVYCTVESS